MSMSTSYRLRACLAANHQQADRQAAWHDGHEGCRCVCVTRAMAAEEVCWARRQAVMRWECPAMLISVVRCPSTLGCKKDIPPPARSVTDTPRDNTNNNNNTHKRSIRYASTAPFTLAAVFTSLPMGAPHFAGQIGIVARRLCS